MTETKFLRAPIPRFLIPNITVFFSSACIMIIELSAGRLIARHVGMSLYTWTAIIGIIMMGISIGNHWGGRLADRHRAASLLACLFAAAAVAVAGIPSLNAWMGTFSLLFDLAWPLRIFLHVALVFLLPAMFLGMIHPVVAKMALDLRGSAGAAVGGVYAWGVVGSLVGTFAAGYYLVMVLSATTIIFLAAGGLAALGAIYGMWAILNRKTEFSSSQWSVHAPLISSIRDWAPAAGAVFVSNMSFMIFELAAMRLTSREFGSSLYTWTMVIGMVLAGISLGNYIGGRLADWRNDRTLIATAFTLSALAVVCSPVWGSFINEWRENTFFFARLSWPMQIAVYVFSLCFPPCIFMGLISPVVTRRLLLRGRAPGAAVGVVYAWGSIGAIAGTFLAGYFLIQWLGSFPVVAMASLLLMGAAFCYGPLRMSVIAAMVICIGAFAFSISDRPALRTSGEWLRLRKVSGPHVVYEKESQYSYIAVSENPDDPMVRRMLLDKLMHSEVDLRDPTRLLYEYEWVYSAVVEKQHPLPQPVRAFVIGGGGYAYPHFLEYARPGSEVLVAEIDPAVTEAAHAALGLPRDTNVSIIDMDARNVAADLLRMRVSDAEFKRFDYIFGDSINDYTVPYHLTTLEFTRGIEHLLSDNGVYMLNMIDMLDAGGFLAAVVNTCRQVFPHVAVFNTGRASFIRDTFIVVCSKKALFLDDIPLLLAARHNYIGGRISDEILDGLIKKHQNIILTDEYAPVENLLAPVVRTRAGDLGELHLNFAQKNADAGNLREAIRHAEAAVKVHAAYPKAHELLADLYLVSRESEKALEALRHAVEGHKTPAAAWFRLGKTALEVNNPEVAIDAWNRCISIQPDHVSAHYNLGVAYASQGNVGKAIGAWKEALKHQPNHADSLHNLAAAYLMQHDAESASAVLEAMAAHNIQAGDALKHSLEALRDGASLPRENQ